MLTIGAMLWSRANAADNGFPLITVYSSTEVGFHAMSFSAAQSANGTLVFGGQTLLSFDGDRWTSTPVKNAYAFRGINFDAHDQLWAGAVNDFGWFDHQPDGQWSFHSLRPEWFETNGIVGQVSRAFPDETGTLFVANEHLIRWDGRKVSAWPMPNSKRLFPVKADGTVFVQQPPNGLFAISGTQSQAFIPGEMLANMGVMFMERRTSDWLLATSNGIYLWHDNRLEKWAPEVSAILQQENLICGTHLADGRYAFATLTGGIVLMRFDGSLEQTLAEPEGLPTLGITSLLEDRDHQLWATSWSQIFRVDLSSGVSIFDQRSGLPVQSYDTIAKIGNTIVVGGENGAYLIPSDRGSRAAPLLRGKVNDLKVVGDRLLAAGFKWVKHLHDGSSQTIHDAPKDVFAITSSKRTIGRIYFSGVNNISELIPPGGSRELIEKLPDCAISIAEDESGSLWMGTFARGVFVATPKDDSAVDAIRVDGSAGLPVFEGKSVVRSARNGAILVFADTGGWLKPVGDAKFHPIKNYPRRGVVDASDFGPDDTGWVLHPVSSSSGACIARISITGNDAEWEPHSIPALPAIGLPRSVFVEASGAQAVNLWIGGTKSVLRQPVNGPPSAPRPRAPLLHKFMRSAANSERQLMAQSLPYSTQSIEFEFSEPEFMRRASLRLQTRIDGVDSDWQPVAQDARRMLTAVRNGNYTFRVRAVAETGVASEETVFKFQVLPPWWRTQSAMGGEALAAALMLWGAYGWRVRSLRRRNEQLEQKVRQRTKELEEASAAKTQFVANMSHDIRNPLNGIVGLALALENTKLDRRQRELVATLRECSTYLSSLVDDVLDFASIEAGRVELRPGPFVPQELLRSIVNTLGAEAEARGALLLVEADPHLPPHILGDAGRIQQILVNFVSNALKYAGGQIRLSVSTPVDAFGEIEFAVTDEGPGMSAEEQRTLFTKFTRVKRTQDNDIPGTGLGLAACRLLADLMGGSVGVESRAGAGARFFLRLPLEIATAPAERPAANLPNTSVLVVEDTDYNAWAAEAVLAKLGLTCERARTGAEALQMFAAKRFNVVLLDRNLPDLDGTEVARQMRAAEAEGPPAVLLAVTAYCTAEDRALCLEAGMDAFVGKPLTPEKLRRVLIEAGRKMLTTASFHVSSDTTAPLPAQAIDVTLLRYLSDGTPEGFDAQLQRFLGALREAANQLGSVVAAADYPGAATSAHSLLGPAKMVGATSLIEACERLEAAARSRDVTGVESRMERVREEIRVLTAAVQRHRSAPQST